MVIHAQPARCSFATNNVLDLVSMLGLSEFTGEHYVRTYQLGRMDGSFLLRPSDHHKTSLKHLHLSATLHIHLRNAVILFWHVNINPVFAMNNDTSPAIGALILVPIVIAASAAFIAIKTSETLQRAVHYCSKLWSEHSPWSHTQKTQKRSKLRRSNLPSTQLYADSWCDLESGDDDPRYTPFNGQDRRSKSYSEGDKDAVEIELETPSKVWHPTRSARLMWSFTNPRSLSPLRFELSSVAKPSQAARPPVKPSGDANRLAQPSARGAHRWEQTDL